MNNIDKLKGKTILVGKEPGNGRLFISVKINGQPKMTTIGEMNSVPNSVSRCKPAENIGHCKIDVDNTGAIKVTNLKPQNVTYVNGVEIISKTVTNDSFIELGKDKYSINVGSIIDTISKAIGESTPPPAQEYSIKSLKIVWEEYDTKRTEEQLSEQKRNNIQKLGGIFSSCGILFMFIEGMGDLRFVLTGFSVLIAIIFFVRGLNTSNSLLVRLKDLDADFRKKYTCPNPECHHFMGNIPYDVLRTNKKCSYCGCKFNEK